ncbi:MAG: DUF1570 domain-containing protein [Planctomycetota bacterium]
MLRRLRHARWQTTLLVATIAGAAFSVGSCAEQSRPIYVADEPHALGNSSFTPMGAVASETVVTPEAPETEIQFQTTPWQWRELNGLVIATPHYDVHTTIEDPRVLDVLPSFFERALQHYRSTLAKLPPPTGRFETYIFADRREWRLKTWEVLPQQAGQFMNLGRGGFATRGIAVLYFIDYRKGNPHDTLAIAAHEGWHQYTQKTFRHQLPIWLEEGIATYMEGFRTTPEGFIFIPRVNPERRRELARAVREDRLIPLGELLSNSPQDFLATGKNRLLTYYAQVWALTRFLVEYDDGTYRDALEEALNDAANGELVGRLMGAEARRSTSRSFSGLDTRTGPWLIQAYFTEDMVEFRQQYEQYMRDLVRPRAELTTPGRS